MRDYFKDDYWNDAYFHPEYFGPTEDVPGSMAGSFSAVATFSGALGVADEPSRRVFGGIAQARVRRQRQQDDEAAEWLLLAA